MLPPDHSKAERASRKPQSHVEGDDRQRSAARPFGGGEVQGIERSRARRETELGGTATNRVIERNHERSLPVALESRGG